MKSLVTYAVLVGLPGVGLLGILRAGQNLRAPHAIGGEWKVESGTLAGESLKVEQSGEHVVLVIPGARVNGAPVPAKRLRGRMRGDTLAVRGPGGFLPGSHTCTAEGDGTVRLVADRAARRLAGVADDRCRTERISAAQVAAPGKRGGGH